MKISNFLAQHAINELMLMGYTVVKGRLVPPEQLSQDACEYFGVMRLPLYNTSIEVKPFAAEEKVNPYSLREADNFKVDVLVNNKVRVMHLPTLLYAESGEKRSQHSNREAAFASLNDLLDTLQKDWKSE